MIWNDPWIDLATDSPPEGMGIAPFCTTFPPPRPQGSPDLRFDCCAASLMTDTELTAWRSLVGTQWPITGLRRRLEGAWIARIHTVAGTLVSTCVLRRSPTPVWILETLVAKPTGNGYATALVRAAMTWIWTTNVENGGGPFVLAYTWELSLAQLVWAKWRGWLKSTAAVEYGWIWTPPTACQFCSSDTKIWPVGSAQLLTIGGDSEKIVMSDSGLGDGLGYVLSVEMGASVDWSAVARAGGWRSLWWRGTSPPTRDGWRWTGEFVVVGLLNYDGRSAGIPTRWVSPEVAPKSCG